MRNAAVASPDDESSEDRAAHRRIRQFWLSCVKYAEECGEANAKENEEAERFYKGGDGEWEASDKEITGEVRVSVNAFHRDVELLTAHCIHSDPKIRCRESKSKRFRGFAQALSAFGNKAYLEKKVRAEVKKALKEAIFRNVAFIRVGWDSYRWLPSFEWCSEPVYLDPDCGGDSRQAKYVLERCTMRLDELLADETIEERIREKLKTRKGLNLLESGGKPLVPGETRQARDWDEQPGFKKIVVWRIHSRVGAYPFGTLGKGGASDVGLGVETSAREDDPALARFKAAPDYGTDRAPKPQQDDIDQKRVYLLLIEGFDEIVKMGPWEMDWFDREDFPYIPVRLKELPGDLYGGSSFYKVLKPLYKAKNWFFSFLMNRAKAVARSLLVAHKEAFSEDQKRALAKGAMFQIVWSEQPNAQVTPIDMVSRGTEHLETLDRIDNEHDKTSGINDVARGEAGQVEKTASEAQMLQDQTEAGFSVLDESVEEVHAEVARYMVMASERYVRGRSDYVPCPKCGVPCEACSVEDEETGEKIAGEGCEECYWLGTEKGPGTVMAPAPIGPPAPVMPEPGMPPDPAALLAAGAPPMPQPMPCPMCQGSGWQEPRGQPLRRGADYYISEELAAQWIDDIPVEEIRAEVEVGIEPGSARKDHRERRVGLISSMIERTVPVLQPLAPIAPQVIIPKILTLVSESIKATEIPGAEEWAFTDAEIAAVVQGAQQQAQAQAAAAAGPSPEQIAAQQQQEQAAAQAAEEAKAQQERVKIDADQQKHQAELQFRAMAEQRKADMEEKRFAAEQERALAAQSATEQDAGSRAEVELAKLVLEERRQKMEEQAQMEAMQKYTDLLSQMQEQFQQQQAQMTQTLQAMGAVLKQIPQDSARVAEATKASVTEVAEAAKAAVETTAKAVQEVKAIIAAPKKVTIQREEGPLGRIESANVTPAKETT